MKKKGKLLASLLSFCFALAVLGFGVYAAQTVSYTIGGTVNYSASSDVFADITTKVYRSKAQNVLSVGNTSTSGTLAYIQDHLKDATSNLNTVATGTEQGQLGLEEVTLTQRDGNTVNNGDVSASTLTSGGAISSENNFSVSGLSLEYGRWAEVEENNVMVSNNKGYAYFIVVQITNRGENKIGVTVDTTPVANTFLGFDSSALNSNTVFSESGNAEKNAGHNQVTNFVFAFGLNNPTVGVSSNVANFAIKLSLSTTQVSVNITDLTGTRWKINSINCDAGYGKFNISGSVYDQNGSAPSGGVVMDYLNIGYGLNFEIGFYDSSNRIVYCSGPSYLAADYTIEIDSGNDVTNAMLIAWLEANGAML